MHRTSYKPRPVVLIAPVGESQWMAMGLTTLTHFANGLPRVPVPDWHAVGLTRQAYLWAPSLVRISSLDIGRVIGLADAALMRSIEQYLKTYREPAG